MEHQTSTTSTIKGSATAVTSTPSTTQARSIIFAPYLVKLISGPKTTLQSSINDTRRFRRILPKDDQRYVNSQQLLPLKVNGAANSKSYIIVIPTFNNTKPIIVPQTFQPCDGKKPALSITVNRKYNNPLTDRNVQSTDCNKVNNDKEETVIYSEKLNKYVVFTLDLKTEKIIVSRRDTRYKNSKYQLYSEKVIKPGKLIKEISEPLESRGESVTNIETVADNVEISSREYINYTRSTTTGNVSAMQENHFTNPEKLDYNNQVHVKESEKPNVDMDNQICKSLTSKYADIYEKANRDCSNLLARLHNLRDRYQQERVAIEKLQIESNAIKRTEGLVVDSIKAENKRKHSMDIQCDYLENKRLLLNDGTTLANVNQHQIESNTAASTISNSCDDLFREKINPLTPSIENEPNQTIPVVTSSDYRI